MIRNVMWLVRLLYLPLFLLVGNGVAVYLVAEGFNAGWLGFLILVFIGISFATERLIPMIGRLMSLNRISGAICSMHS